MIQTDPVTLACLRRSGQKHNLHLCQLILCLVAGKHCVFLKPKYVAGDAAKKQTVCKTKNKRLLAQDG